jgi:hypothetical protein
MVDITTTGNMRRITLPITPTGQAWLPVAPEEATRVRPGDVLRIDAYDTERGVVEARLYSNDS